MTALQSESIYENFFINEAFPNDIELNSNQAAAFQEIRKKSEKEFCP